MTEAEARAWIEDRYGVPRGTAVTRFVAMVIEQAEHQNLIARSTIDAIWHRHVVDSAQLLGLADDFSGCWVDVGSGAGFPGMVVALLSEREVTLVEPRRKRAEVLRDAVARLGLERRVEVLPSRVETVRRPAAVLSARAVASLDMLFSAASGCATATTRWLLPRGRSATEEVQLARRSWHGRFTLMPSITDEESRIVVADQVSRR